MADARNVMLSLLIRSFLPVNARSGCFCYGEVSTIKQLNITFHWCAIITLTLPLYENIKQQRHYGAWPPTRDASLHCVRVEFTDKRKPVSTQRTHGSSGGREQQRQQRRECYFITDRTPSLLQPTTSKTADCGPIFGYFGTEWLPKNS